MASRKKRRRISSAVKESCHFKNKKQTEQDEDSVEFSDIGDEYLDSLFSATKSVHRKPIIQSVTIQTGESRVIALDVKDFTEISYAPCFSTDIHVLLSEKNTVFTKKGHKISRKYKKTNSNVQTQQSFERVKLLRHSADVTALSYASGNLLLSCSVDGMVKVWDGNYDPVQSYTDTRKSISDIHSSSNLEHFATTSLNGMRNEKGAIVYGASLFSFSRKDPLLVFARHTLPTQCIRFHANGMYACTASQDGMVHMWSTLEHKAPVRTFNDGGPDHQKRVQFSPDGKYLATTHRGSVNIWDLASGRLLHSVGVVDSSPAQSSVNDVCFSSSGRQLATGTTDGQLNIWDIHSAVTGESFSTTLSENHILDGPILGIRCTGDVYTCIC